MEINDHEQLIGLAQSVKDCQDSLQNKEGYLLEFHWNEEERTARLEGNSAGLLHLCRLVMDLCIKGYQGAHLHFDENSNFPEGSDAMIIEWKQS